MKATKDFFTDLRKVIELNAEDVQSTNEEYSPKDNEVYELFAGCGGIDLENESIKRLMTLVKATLNCRDAKIDYLESHINTTVAEKKVISNILDSEELNSGIFDCNGDLSKLDFDDSKEENLTAQEPIDDIIQKLSDLQQRELELRNALKEEREKNKPDEGIERIPIFAFLDYADTQIPAIQYTKAKILKEILGDVYNINEFDKETLTRWRNIGCKDVQYNQNNYVQGDLVGQKIKDNYGPNLGIEAGANVITSCNNPQIPNI